MRRVWKLIVTATVFAAACDASFGQAATTAAAPRRAAESMHIGARITDERVNVRTGPGAEYERTRLVDRETRVTVTAREGGWVQVTLPSGATGWVGLKFVDPERAIVTAKPAPTNSAPAKPAVQPHAQPGAQTATKPSPAVAAPVSSAGSTVQQQANVPLPKEAPPARTPAAPATGSGSAGLLAGTKPDILGGAKDTPVATAGDSFRMVLVLLPVLGGIVLAVRGLKAVQQRTGTLPDLRKGFRGAILGGFNLNNARKAGGSSLRVLESIPIGTASLHLIEARGRVLLLGASGGSLTTLADLSGSSDSASTADGDTDFHSVLNAMSEDLADEYEDVPGSIGLTVGSLEDRIRETREAITRASVRTRG